MQNGVIFKTRPSNREVSIWDNTDTADAIPDLPVKTIQTGNTGNISGIDVTETSVVTIDVDGMVNIITVDP